MCEVCHGMQAMDARRFAHDPDDAAARQQALFAEQANAALAQTPGHPVPLEEQVLSLRQNAALSMVLAAACSLLPHSRLASQCRDNGLRLH